MRAIQEGSLLPDILCFSHLRWNHVYQRPQHLLCRFARTSRVFFFEEPIYAGGRQSELVMSNPAENVFVLTPHIVEDLPKEQENEKLRELLAKWIVSEGPERYLAWYYTPMALAFTGDLSPEIIVFDCMDELSAFAGAPPQLLEMEERLLQVADVVFTGGHSLFQAKQGRHPNIHPFPSGIEIEHFSKAREALPDPEDQSAIPHPRMGFFGVIDERSDLELLRAAADLEPNWQFVMLGPVVKIDPSTLPQRPNIHYLGQKSYRMLPSYLSNWDVALLPFARNESTRFISPTKTPEYLAGGKPVVSTSITDVIRPYGDQGLVYIADSPDDFVAAIRQALGKQQDALWLQRVDRHLAGISWDKIQQGMQSLMLDALTQRIPRQATL